MVISSMALALRRLTSISMIRNNTGVGGNAVNGVVPTPVFLFLWFSRGVFDKKKNIFKFFGYAETSSRSFGINRDLIIFVLLIPKNLLTCMTSSHFL